MAAVLRATTVALAALPHAHAAAKPNILLVVADDVSASRHQPQPRQSAGATTLAAAECLAPPARCPLGRTRAAAECLQVSSLSITHKDSSRLTNAVWYSPNQSGLCLTTLPAARRSSATTTWASRHRPSR